MSQDQELQKWNVRWDSLSKEMKWLSSEIATTNIQEKVTLQNLIDGLAPKGEEHAIYFLKGFSKKPQLYQLSEDKPKGNQIRFSRDYALRKVLDRIAFDLDVIYRIFKQRSDVRLDTSLEKTLDLADELALQALQPAIDRELIGPGTKALTYLQKSYETRVIPYAEVSLIGIPFTSARLTEDLLAIPHEVGHYVFWNGGRKYKKWEKQLDTLRKKNRKDKFRWTEEIFADVYGCIVAGPVMALDFQDLQLEFAGFDPITEINEFEDGVDKVHPTPILRPRIYTETLKKMKTRGVTSTELGDLEEIADRLDSRWDMKLSERGYHQPPDLQAEISEVIDEALDILEPENAIPGVWTNQSVQNVEDLYEHFYHYAGKPHGPNPAMEITAVSEEEVVSGMREEIFVDEWLEKLRADGWTTEGPHGRS